MTDLEKCNYCSRSLKRNRDGGLMGCEDTECFGHKCVVGPRYNPPSAEEIERNTTIPAPSCAPTIPPGDYARIGRAGHALTCVLEAIMYAQQSRNEPLADALHRAEMIIRGEIG